MFCSDTVIQLVQLCQHVFFPSFVFSGILVPGGFGVRGTEGKIHAINWARKQKKPFLGTESHMITLFSIFYPVSFLNGSISGGLLSAGVCLGMQLAVCEFARNVLSWTGNTNVTAAAVNSVMFCCYVLRKPFGDWCPSNVSEVENQLSFLCPLVMMRPNTTV